MYAFVEVDGYAVPKLLSIGMILILVYKGRNVLLSLCMRPMAGDPHHPVLRVDYCGFLSRCAFIPVEGAQFEPPFMFRCFVCQAWCNRTGQIQQMHREMQAAQRSAWCCCTRAPCVWCRPPPLPAGHQYFYASFVMFTPCVYCCPPLRSEELVVPRPVALAPPPVVLAPPPVLIDIAAAPVLTEPLLRN